MTISSYISLLIIYNLFLSHVGMVSSIPIMLYVTDMNRLLKGKEGTSELWKLNLTKRRRVWKRTSNQYFKAGRSCQYKSEHSECVATFMFCDSTPNRSSFERNIILKGKLLIRTPTDKRDLVKVEDIPFYTTAEESCFIASIKPFIARKIAKTVCNRIDRPCVIHPLLPMLKLAYRTVETITENANNSGSQLVIMAEISPYFRKNKEKIELETVAERAIQQSTTKSNCHANLEDTFPYTKPTIPCENIVDPAYVESQWMSDSVAAYHITPSADDSPDIRRDKLLSFLASLAVRPEFSSIEVSEYYYYFYSF